MDRHLHLSNHCLSDHSAGPPEGEKMPMTPVWIMRFALLKLDKIMHFTGLWGLAWRLVGVNRSPKNPNVCNF